MANPNRRDSGPPNRQNSGRVRAVPAIQKPQTAAPLASTTTVTRNGGNARPATAPAARPATQPPARPATQTPQRGATNRPSTQVPTRTTSGSRTGSHAVSRPATHSPGRRGVSDRQSRDITGNRSSQTPAKGRMGKTRGMGLRAKFMLALAGITVLAMTILGISMSMEANKYLLSQKIHDGIELAMYAEQLANSAAQQLRLLESHQDDKNSLLSIDERKKVAKDLVINLSNAAEWKGLKGATDVLSVYYSESNIPELQGIGYGPPETEDGVNPGAPITNLFLPKDGNSVALDAQIAVYPALKHTENGQIPIYRFKIALDPLRFGEGANVRVDVDARGIDNVRNNLTIAILFGVMLAIGAVIGVANYLAGNITRPVKILLKDMQVVALGNLAHQTRSHSTDEVGILALEFNRMTENLQEAQVALVEQEKAEYELSIAREVQKQLLPAEPPQIAGFVCADYYKGAKAVSGDYYDFIPLGNGLWGFIVADVSGKGIPGSMVMAVTRTIVRLIAVKHQDRAADTLKETNRLIAKQIKRGMFVTSFYAVLDERTGSLTYSSAGHNPMVIYRGATHQHELATGKGIALGFNEGPIFDKTIEEHRTVLGKGDAIVLYTDGFPEAMNDQNVEFGEDRFYGMIASLGHLDSPSLIDRLVNAVAEHRGDAEQSDDLTLITVRRA
jgi:serine phosphatase RsbU (regulator of sigma subunit)